MISIIALQCRSVGNLPDCKIEFSKGLSFVTGKNEAGKSTIIRAIADTLFGAEDDTLRPVGFSGDYGAAIRLTTSSGEYVFDRNFATNRVQIFRLENKELSKQFDAKASPRGRSSDSNAYLQRLEEILGISDRRLFEASVLLDRQAMGLGKKETVDKIKQILAGQATHDYDAVRNGLWDQYFRITNVNPDGRNKTKPRILQQELSSLENYKLQLARAQESNEQCNQTRNQIKELDKLAQKQSHRIKKTDTMIKLAANFLQLDENIRQADEKLNGYYDDRRRITELKTKIGVMDNEVAKLGVAAHIDEKEAEQLRNRVSLHSRIETQTATTKSADDDLSEILAESRLGMIFCWTIALVALLAGLFLVLYGWYASWALFVIAVGLGGVGLYLRGIRKTKIVQKKAALQLAQEELDRLNETRSKFKIRPELLELGETGIPDILAQREKGFALLREKEKYEAQLEMLPSSSDVEESIRRSQKMIVKTQVEQEELAKINPDIKSVTHDQLVDLISQLEELQHMLIKTEEQSSEARERYATQKATAENPEALEEQIALANEQVESLAHRSEALLEAVRAVQWAIKEYRGEYLVNFSADVDVLFSSLVDDSERNVFLTKELLPSLQTDKGTLSLDRLSAGTRDMLYLAARIALSEKMSQHNRLPLIFDDALVNFDEERKRRTIEKLCEISKERQVLLFTHDESQVEMTKGQGTVIRV